MGLKQDLIDGVVKAARETGFPDERDIDSSPGSTIERNAEYMKEAIVDFLTKCEFRITQLNAPVVLEDFKIPRQGVDLEPKTLVGDKAPIIDAFKIIPGGGAAADAIQNTLRKVTKPLLRGGAFLPNIDVEKDGGGLNSTGYVYIGTNPDSQDTFDVDDESGQRQFTTVKLIRDDIEDLL